jgi:hypothetical protein
MAQFGDAPSVLGQVIRQPLVFVGVLQPHLDVRAITFARTILFLPLVNAIRRRLLERPACAVPSAPLIATGLVIFHCRRGSFMDRIFIEQVEQQLVAHMQLAAEHRRETV